MDSILDVAGEETVAEKTLRNGSKKARYIIEDLFPAGRVHLIGGASGVGKTTMLFQLYKALHDTPPSDFLGRRTMPVKWAYISGDRAVDSVYETQERLEVKFPVFSLVDENLVGADLTGKILPRLTSLYGYRPDFIYIDGFTGMCPDGQVNNYKVVSSWLAGLQRYCKIKGVTIVGACHTTKVKEGEKFLDPRQKILGSVAWASYSEGVIIIESGEKDNQRIVSLLPRNHPNEMLNMSLNDQGWFELPERIAKAEGYSRFIIDTILEGREKIPGAKFDYSHLMSVAVKKGVNRRTFDRYIAKEVEDGKLVRVRKGEYVIGEGKASNEQGETGTGASVN
jgi:KaiC/GvpD/RAD55 family RecA-like ATPase